MVHHVNHQRCVALVTPFDRFDVCFTEAASGGQKALQADDIEAAITIPAEREVGIP